MTSLWTHLLVSAGMLYTLPAFASDPVPLMSEIPPHGLDPHEVVVDPVVTTTEHPIAEAADHGADIAHAAIPHMEVSTFAGQLFWLAISFGVLYLIMSRIALPQIHDILEHRQHTVESNLERAAKLRDEAEDVQIAYDKALRQAENHAQEFLNNSLNDVSDKNALALSAAMDKVLDKIQESEKNIAVKREEMMKDATKIADDIANVLTEKVLTMQQLNADKTKKRA